MQRVIAMEISLVPSKRFQAPAQRCVGSLIF